MLCRERGHFVHKVIVKDRTSLMDFLPKRIGARIWTRHTTILLDSDQVVDVTWDFGRGSEGLILWGIFSNFLMRIMELMMLALT